MSETDASFQATENIGDKHKLLGLDHLRAIAISYVLLFHYQFFGHPAWATTGSKFIAVGFSRRNDDTELLASAETRR